MDNRLASLRRILRIHINWLTVKLLGKELVSKEELVELKDYGRLDLGDEVGLIESSFVLGRISALSKKSEYKDITLEKLSMLKKRKFSSIEKLAIREAKLHASRRLQTLSEDAAAGAFARVNKATQDLLADATAKDIIQEELALAIAEKKTRKELAASVGNKLGSDLTAGFRKLIVTEMHRAKTRGIAMAISNKVDIYSSSEGANSIVSVVPNRGACKDCENLYLSETGDPRTFKLSDLVGQGTNADPGISHARTHGLHLGWRPVMPPAHPNCFCELVYVPAGMGWKNGKLVVVDEFKYKEQISKAVDKSTMSATITPKGAPSNQGDKTPKPSSLPKPGSNVDTIAAPPLDLSANASTSPGSSGEQPQITDATGPELKPGYIWEYYRGKGTPEAPTDGKPPYEQSRQSGAWRRQMPEGGWGTEEALETGQQMPPEVFEVQKQKVANYKHGDYARFVAKDHIENGTVFSSRSLKKHDIPGKQAGINDAFKDDIVDNGSMLKKPGDAAFGSEIQREASASNGHVLAGSDRCPPTFVRTKDKTGAASGQVWLGEYTNGCSAVEAIFGRHLNQFIGKDTPIHGRLVKAIFEAAPDKDVADEQMATIAVTDMLHNNTDRHIENFMISEDFSQIMAIDHGYCFEPGLLSYKCKLHEGYHATGRDLKLPAKMRTKLENTSYGDMEKAHGDHLQEWQIAQTYLRQEYILHIADENEGKLPYDAFQGEYTLERTTGNDRFEDFMVDWIDENAANPDSPDHETAKYFDQIGVFIDPSNVRASSLAMNVEISIGANYAYEQDVRGKKAEAEARRNPNAKWVVDAKAKHDKAIDEINAPRLAKLDTEIETLNTEFGKLLGEINDYKDKKDQDPRVLRVMEAKATDVEQKLEQNLKEYHRIKQATDRQKEVERRMFNIVPEGAREKFDELQEKVNAARENRRTGKRVGNAYRREPGIQVFSPAEIERKKRNRGRK